MVGYSQPVKRFGAFLGYALATVMALLNYKLADCRMRLDDREWICLPSLSVRFFPTPLLLCKIYLCTSGTSFSFCLLNVGPCMLLP